MSASNQLASHLRQGLVKGHQGHPLGIAEGQILRMVRVRGGPFVHLQWLGLEVVLEEVLALV